MTAKDGHADDVGGDSDQHEHGEHAGLHHGLHELRAVGADETTPRPLQHGPAVHGEGAVGGTVHLVRPAAVQPVRLVAHGVRAVVVRAVRDVTVRAVRDVTVHVSVLVSHADRSVGGAV